MFAFSWQMFSNTPHLCSNHCHCIFFFGTFSNAMQRQDQNHKKIVHFPENLSSVVFASFKTLSPHLPTADPHLQATHREGRSYRLVFLQQEHWTIDLQNLKSLGHFKRQIMFNLSTIWHDFSVTLTISIFVPQHNENSISRHWNRFINSFIYL